MKKCNICKINKELEEFHKKKSSKSGYRSICKECRKIQSKIYNEKNKDEIAKRRHKHYIENKDEISLYRKEKYYLNKDLINKKRREEYKNKRNYILRKNKKYRNNHKDRIRLLKQTYYEENKEKIRIYKREYYQKNKHILREKINKYYNYRYNNDESFRIKYLLRHRIREAFKRHSKRGKIMASKDYGINYEEIINYIGKCPGDRNKYHIDHIIPLSIFDFNKLDHIKIALSPENHQWLEKNKNLRKSNKIGDYTFKLITYLGKIYNIDIYEILKNGE